MTMGGGVGLEKGREDGQTFLTWPSQVPEQWPGPHHCCFCPQRAKLSGDQLGLPVFLGVPHKEGWAGKQHSEASKPGPGDAEDRSQHLLRPGRWQGRTCWVRALKNEAWAPHLAGSRGSQSWACVPLRRAS